MKNLTTNFEGKTIQKAGLYDNQFVLSFTDNTFGVLKVTTPELDEATDELSGGELFVGKIFEPKITFEGNNESRNQFLIDMGIATNDELFETIIVPKEDLFWAIDKSNEEYKEIINVSIGCDCAAEGSSGQLVEVIVELPKNSGAIIEEINNNLRSGGETKQTLLTILLLFFSLTSLFSQPHTNYRVNNTSNATASADVLNCDCPPLGIKYLVADTLPVLSSESAGNRLYIGTSGNTMTISDTIIPGVAQEQIAPQSLTLQGTTPMEFIKTIDTSDVIIQYVSKWVTGESKTTRAIRITETLQKTNSFFHTISVKYKFMSYYDDRNIMDKYKLVDGKLIPLDVEPIWLDIPQDIILQVWEAKGYKSW